ncbi:MAG: hypothetical protein WCH61_02140, partial [bacterium]
VYWYLFNDVVPAQFLGRFFGAFRIVGGAAGASYNYFLFKYAESQMREIFIGATILYAIGIGMMCLMVKEGGYPPLDEDTTKKARGLAGVKSFLRESFSHRFYLAVFTFTSMLAVIGAAGKFNVFFLKEMGLSLEDIGKSTAVMGLVGLGAMYFTAIFVDRWHPLRVAMYWSIFVVIGNLGNWVWIFVTLPAPYFFWLNIMGVGLIGAFFGALGGACFFPLCMRTFPKSRFGQFCSAQALLRSVLDIAAGVLSGVFFDLMCQVSANANFGYRYGFVWNTVCSVMMAAIGVYVYLQWHRLGADEHFRSPAPWNPTGFEETDTVPLTGPQYPWLNLSLVLLRLTMLLSVVALPVLLWWMRVKGAALAFHWHAVLLLPASVIIWGWWWWLERSIRADLARCAAGETPREGILHHGVLIVVAVNYLMALAIWLTEVVVAINLKLEIGAITFTVANLVTNVLLIASLYILRRVERHRSLTIGSILL